MSRQTNASRREFLHKLACAVCAGGSSAFLPQLHMMGTALAASGRAKAAPYRALVCLYLAGGNDSWNLLMPAPASGAAYTSYLTARGGIFPGANGSGLAIDGALMLPISPLGLPPADSFGLHPECKDRPYATAGTGTTPGLQTLFNQQRLAFVANVGTLVQPTNKMEYNTPGYPKPPQLFSHNDQENLWHLGRTDRNWRQGWGGMTAAQLTAGGNGDPALSPCISIAGSNRFQVGEVLATGAPISPYQMTSGGATALNNYTDGSFQGAARRTALNKLLDQAYPHLFSNEYRTVFDRGYDLSITLGGLLGVPGQTAVESSQLNTGYQSTGTHNPALAQYGTAQVTVGGVNYSNSLLDQLRMVARMIKLSRDPLAGINADKQIFYVRLGGFDTHDTQMNNNGQPLLMARVSQAVGFFSQAMSEIGAQGDVVLFSMSEFARTLTSNGNGSDHAWGGVQFAMGAPVSAGGPLVGQTIYGTYPNIALNQDDAASKTWSLSRGQFIPSTGVEQFVGRLALWAGVEPAALTGADGIFPNLGNFGATAADATLPFLPVA